MKRSKAFILVEVLTGMALQTGFIIVLCTSFYLMLSFYTRTQQYLNARQKGEKVIAYVDSRIRNVGLGLGKCSSSSEIREALSNVSLAGMKPALTLPVGITKGDGSNLQDNKNTREISGNKIRGNILTLLYTQRASDYNFTIRTIESADTIVSTNTIVSGCNYPITVTQNEEEVGFVTGKSGTKDYRASDFYKSAIPRTGRLNKYTVMSGAGKPVYIASDPDDNYGKFKLALQYSSSVEVYPGDELMYLKCERIFVNGTNFYFQHFQDFPDNATKWGNQYANESGILEVYFELDTSTNILDMYVLASGGVNDAGNTQRPVSWPSDFWKTEFANYMIYVSRASWKLSNISSSFTWN